MIHFLYNPRTRQGLWVLILLGFFSGGFAQTVQWKDRDPQAGVMWSELSVDQQQLLSRFEKRWSQLPPQRQLVLARSSWRWLKMTPDQRNAAKESIEKLHLLTEEQRQKIRERASHFQDLSPDEQQKLRDSYMEFRRLSDERRKALKEQWDQLSEERRAWRERHHGHHSGKSDPAPDEHSRDHDGL